jgi:hypothetical protein
VDVVWRRRVVLLAPRVGLAELILMQLLTLVLLLGLAELILMQLLTLVLLVGLAELMLMQLLTLVLLVDPSLLAAKWRESAKQFETKNVYRTKNNKNPFFNIVDQLMRYLSRVHLRHIPFR